MKLMIVDDESLARERLARLLGEIKGVRLVGEAANGEAALHFLQQHSADVVLLDIRMPGMNGMETAHQMAQLPEPPLVIFVTAYGEHALEAFEAEALDYLVKPVRIERLQQALERAQRLRPLRQESPRLTVRKHGELHWIALDEIRYFQADHKYVTAYMDGREELLEQSLKQLEEDYPERLLRVHRNALVSVRAMEGLERQADGSWRVRLRDMAQGPEISRRHLAEVRRILRQT